MGNNGKALVFDEMFYLRPIKDQLEYMMKLCASQNDALDIMQKERDMWLKKALQLEQSVENAQQAFDIQKNIVGNMVTKANDDNQVNGERIHELEKKIGELGGHLN